MGILGRGFCKTVVKYYVGEQPCALLRARNSYPLIREAQLLRRFIGKKYLLQPLSEYVVQTCYMRNEVPVELAEFGSFMDLVDSLEFEGKLGDITPAHIDEVMQQVNCALDELQSLGLRHNDLNARNILVFQFCASEPEQTRVKLCDFSETQEGPRDCVKTLRRELEMLVH